MKRSIQLVFSTNILFLGLSVVTSLLSAWALGPNGRGELAIITMWLFIFTLAGTLGLPYAHRYWAARKPSWHSHIFTNTLLFSAFASVLVIAAGWIAIPFILGGQNGQLIRLTQLFLLNVPVILMSELMRGHLEGAKLFGWLGFARIVFIAVQAGGYLGFWLAGELDLLNALYIIIVAQLVCTSLMFSGIVYSLRPGIRFSFPIFKKEIHYALRGYFGALTEFAVWRLDQILLTALAAASVIGLYAVAVAIADIAVTLASSVSDALLPEIAGSKDARKSSSLLGKSLRLTLYAQMLALIPLWILAPYVLGYVFGEEFVPAATVLRLLLVASVFWSAGAIFISGLNGLGKPEHSTFARICSGLVTVFTLLALLPAYGITGAAISSILGYGVMAAMAAFFFVRQCDVRFWEFIRPRTDDLDVDQLVAIIRDRRIFGRRLGFGTHRAD